MHQQLRQSTNRALKEFAKRSSIWSRFLREFDSLSCIRLAVSGFVVLSSLLYCSASNAPRAEQTVSISSTAAGNSGTGVTEGRPFNFNVSVPLATDTELTVAYTVATSNSSAISGLSNGNVTIKAGESSGTGTIAMATTSNVASGSTDTITVTLASGTGYDLDTSPSATNNVVVTVKDNDDSSHVLVSIEGPSTTTVEEGDTLTFTVNTNMAISSDISVNVELSETVMDGDSYLRDGEKIVVVPLNTMDNSGGTASKEFTVKTGETDGMPDDFGEDAGTITATVRDMAGTEYLIADTGDVASVTIDDPLPVISILDAPNAMEDSGTAVFVVNSDVKPTRGLQIKYTPVNMVGYFLDTMGGASGVSRDSSTLQFSRPGSTGMFSTNLRVPLADNDADEVNGMIEVTLGTFDPATYTLDDSNKTASVTIEDDETDDPGPTIELSNMSSSVYSDAQTFPLTVSFDESYNRTAVSYTAFDAEGNAYKFHHYGNTHETYQAAHWHQALGTSATMNVEKPSRTHSNSNFEDSGTGYVEYRIIYRGPKNGNFYQLGSDISEAVYFVSGSNPGIKLEIIETTIKEGEEFTVTATATPAPTTRPATVPITFTDPNNWLADSSGTIVIPTGQTSATKKFQTNHSTDTPTATEIKVTVTPSDTFHVDDSLASDSVMVTETTKLSIEDIAAPVAEGTSVMFKVNATADPGSSFSINYTATSDRTDSIFLTNTSGSQQAASLSFSDTDGDGIYSADLSVPVLATPNNDDDFDEVITVELLETGLGSGYVLDYMQKIATATIHDDTIPELSIANAAATYSNNIANFKISTPDEPKKSLAVLYTPTESTTMFLDPTPTGQGMQRTSVPLTFTENTTSNMWETDLPLPTQFNPGSETSGTITVTLTAEGAGVTRKNYSLSSSSTATVAVSDQADQMVTIASDVAGTTGFGVTEGRPFVFTVNVPEATSKDVEVSYIVSTSDTTNITGLANGTITIPYGESSATGTIAMATTSNVSSGSTDTITVTVANGTGYSPGTPGSIAVTVKDNDDNSLTIASITGPAATGLEEGDDITFTVTTNKLIPTTPPNSSISVNVDVSETVAAGEGFLRDGQQMVQVMLTTTHNNMSTNTASNTFTVKTGVDDGTPSDGGTPDDFDEDAGMITATLRDGTGYVLPDTGDTVSVSIDDPLPVISIENAPEVAEGGGEAVFAISADVMPKNGLAVKYTPTNTIGYFLDTTDGASGTARDSDVLQFTRTGSTGPFTTELRVAVANNTEDEVNGTITISLGMFDPATYTINSANDVATVTILDDESDAGPIINFTGSPVSRYVSTQDATVPFLFNLFYEREAISYGAVDADGNSFKFDHGSSNFLPYRTLFANGKIKGGNLTMEKPAQDSTGADFSMSGTGYVEYRILYRGPNSGGHFYKLGADIAEHVWYVDADKPGISLAITETSVKEGKEFTVTATATPAPTNDTTVAFTFVDPNNWLGVAGDSIVISGGSTSGMKKYKTRHIPGVQAQNEIQVVATPASSYFLDDTLASDTVTVNNTIKLSITINSTPVAEGGTSGNVGFTVTATANPSGDVTINYMASTFWTDSDFLTNASGSQQTATLTNFTGSGNSYTTTLNVPMRAANGEDDFDDVITVELLETGLDAAYLLDESARTAKVAVHDDTVPELSIANATATNSNDDAVFKISTPNEPKEYPVIHYTPTETTTMFLDPAPTGSGVQRTTNPLAFTENTTSNMWEAELRVPTQLNPGSETSGTISVELIAEGSDVARKNYVVSSGSSTATVAVSDQAEQMVSIASAVAGSTGFGVTEGRPFAFTVSVPNTTSTDLAVSYTVSTSDTTNITGLVNGTVTIPKGRSSATGVVAMATSSDVSSGSTDTITVTVADGTGYSPGTPGNIVVTVKDNDDSALTIASVAGPSTTTYEEGDDIVFTVSTNKVIPASTSIMVNVDISETVMAGDSYLRDGERTVQVELVPADNNTGAGTASKTFKVATGEDDGTPADGGVPDDFGEETATITFTMRDGTGYVLPDTGDTASVTIDDPLPVISILDRQDAMEDEESIGIRISSEIKPKGGLAINYTPEETTGHFLDLSVGAAGLARTSPVLEFFRRSSTGPFIALLDLAVDDDEEWEIDGSITVTLNEDPMNKYTVNSASNNTVVKVIDDESLGDENVAPTVTIASRPERYVTGNNFNMQFKFSRSYNNRNFYYGSIDDLGSKFLYADGNDHKRIWINPLPVTTLSRSVEKPANFMDGSPFSIGKVTYLILTSGNKYFLGNYVQDHVWFVNAAKPGITLTISESSVNEGKDEFTVVATATPAPTNDITVAFTFVDPNDRLGVASDSIVISGGSPSGMKKYKTRHIPGVQAQNEIQAVATTASGYFLDDTLASDTVTVNDTIKLSIADNSTPVPEGGTSGNAGFTVTATGNPSTDVIINYMASTYRSDSDFLTNASGSQQMATLTNFTGSGNSYTATLNVPMKAANGEDDFDDVITVELLETGLDAVYLLDESARTAEVAVHDDTIPELSIANAAATSSNDDAVFKISTPNEPKEYPSILYTPTETTTMFLDPTPTGSGVQRTTNPLAFTENTTSNMWEAELRVPTQLNPGSETSGTISVELIAEGSDVARKNYAVSSGNSTATVAVSDQAEQMASITSAVAGSSGFGVTEGRPFAFTVSVPNTTSTDLAVSYTVTTSDTTNITGLANGTITIPMGSSSATGVVAMAASSDVSSGSTDTITVTVADGTGYSPGTPGNIVVTVKDNDDSALTIASVAGPSTTTYEEGDDIVFTVSTNKVIPASTSIMVNVDINETVMAGDSYLRDGERTVQVELVPADNNTGAGTASKTFKVTTGEDDGTPSDGGVPDDFGEEMATITFTLRDGTGYVLPDTGDTASVTIDDPLPVVSILDRRYVTEDDGPVLFTLSSDIMPKGELAITYTPENTTGYFLDLTEGASGAARTSNLGFFRRSAAGPFTAHLSLALDNDDEWETEGVITVTLNDDPMNKYTVNSASKSVELDVRDDETGASAPEVNFTSTTPRYVTGNDFKWGVKFSSAYDDNAFYYGFIDDNGRSFKRSNGDGYVYVWLKEGTTDAAVDFQKPAKYHDDSAFSIGKVNYRPLTTDRRYIIGSNSQEHVWFVNASKPGITLTISESSVNEGKDEISVVATATPAPTSDTTVSFTFVDPNNWLGVAGDSILISGGSPSGMKKYKTRHIPGVQAQNEIQAVATPASGYFLDDTLASDTVTVNDTIKLSIADISTPVAEGGTSGNAGFTVTATANPSGNVMIKYTASTYRSDSDFLTNASGSQQTATLTNFTGGGNSYTATLNVPMKAANGEDDFDDVITVELLETGLDAAYLLDESARTAEVAVHDDTIPELSIANAATTNSNDDAVFKISTPNEPKEYPAIHYTPTETTTMFLDPTPTGSGVQRTTIPLAFTENTTSNMWEAELRVPTQLNPGSETSGTISVELIAEGSDVVRKNYAVSSSSSTATVAVSDQAEQMASIASAVAGSTGFGVTEGRPFAFTVSVPNITSTDLVVSYTVTTSDTTNITGLANGTVTIPKGRSSATGVVAMATSSDVSSGSTDTITVTVADGTGYSPGSPGSIVVAVKDNDDSALTIASVAVPSTTTYEEGDDIVFTVSTNKVIPASTSIMVNVDISEAVMAGDSYLRDGELTVQVELVPADNNTGAGTASKTFKVTTGEDDGTPADGGVPDDFVEEMATITFTVRDGTGYVLPDTGDTASVTIDDPLPVVSILDRLDVTEDRGPVLFALNSDFMPKGELEITYTPENTTGYFLDLTDGASGEARTTNLEFFRRSADGPFIAHLSVALIDDSDPEIDGVIKVTLNEDPNGKYKLNPSEFSTSVMVFDDEIEISTAASVLPLREVYETGNTVLLLVNFSGSGAIHPWIYFGKTNEDGLTFSPHSERETNIPHGIKSRHFTVTKPEKHNDDSTPFTTGYVRYDILSSGNKYKLGEPVGTHVWFVDGNKPGITLSVEESSVIEGQSFTVRATATPSTSQAITVPIDISDPHGILADSVDVNNLSVEIGMGESMGELSIPTKQKIGPQSNDTLTITANTSDDYYLDDSVKSDSVTINYLPVATVSEPTVVEGTAKMEFEISLDENAGSGGVELRYSVATESSAIQGTDFDIATVSASPITISSGSRSGSIVVNLTGNMVDQNEETIVLDFTSISGAIFPGGLQTLKVTGRIIDDQEVGPTASIVEVPDSATLGHSFSFKVRVSPAPTSPLEVALSLSSNLSGGSGGIIESTSLDSTLNSDGNKIVEVPTTGEAEVTVNTTKPNDTGNGMITIGLIAGNPEIYVLGASSAHTISMKDNRMASENEPRLSISHPMENLLVTSYGLATFTITASHMPTGQISVGYKLSETGDYLTTDTDETLSVDLSRTGLTTPLEIPLLDPVADDAIATITVTLLDGNGYTLSDDPQHMATANITDDIVDTVTELISVVSAVRAIEEGEDAEFLISSSDRSSSKTISIEVSQIGNFIFSPVSETVALNNGENRIKIPTIDDSRHSVEQGVITMKILPNEDNYGINANFSMDRILINENDPQNAQSQVVYTVASRALESILGSTQGQAEPPGQSFAEPAIPHVSIESEMDSVEEGSNLVFKFSSSRALNYTLSVNVKLTESGGLISGTNLRKVTIAKGATSSEYQLATLDDNIAEGDGWITAMVNSGSGYVVGDPEGATVIVTDVVDMNARRALLFEANQKVLPELVGSIGARSLSTATERITQAFTSDSRNQIMLGGESSIIGLVKASGEIMNDELLSLQELLGDSSFELGLLPEEGYGNFATVWGAGDFRNFSSSNINSLDGDIFSGHIGFDTTLGEHLVAGLTTSFNQADVDFGNGDDFLEYHTTATGMHPYFGFESNSGDTSIHLIAGYGTGEIELDQKHYETEIFSTSFHNVGFAGSQKIFASNYLIPGGTSELNINSESWVATQYVSGRQDVIGSFSTHTRHAKVNILGTHNQSIGVDSTVVPSVEIGIRNDRKNHQSFLGMELGGGLNFINSRGLDVSSKGEVLVSNLHQIKEWGLSGTLSYDSDNDQLGVIIGMKPEIGATGTDFDDVIWGSDILDHDYDSSMYTSGSRIDMELGYGFSIFEAGTMKPYSGVNFTDTNSQIYRLGSELKLGSNISAELVGSSSVQFHRIVQRRLNLNGTIGW